ncbi:MAG: hypothetical protein KatS3mg027_1022 [Bacteroidia bacterium]|nr:MAG: hypothetical protein KatS3mg027_1022 [Bacteroidia bacterium]
MENTFSPDLFFTFFIIGNFIISLFLFNLFSYFSHSFGVREFQKSEVNRWNPNHKPSVGGFVFYIIFLLTMIFATLLFGIPQQDKIKSMGLWGAATIAFFMGFADDTFNTQPILKSASQLTCALVLILTGTQIHIFENNLLNHFLTILWTVGIMNSINMLDNMDGIAGSISLYIFVFILWIIYHLNFSIFSIHFLLIAGTSISLLAFLFFNFHPSRIFMGDTGSQFLGLLLAYVGIEYIWNFPYDASLLDSIHPVVYKFFLIALVYLIPLTDTTTVTINRILTGGSPFVGGKDHTTHYLCRRGLSERMVFYIFSFIAILSGILAYNLMFHFSVMNLYVSILFCLISFLFLYLNTKLFCSERKSN